MRTRFATLLVTASLLAGASSNAHHSAAMFDETQCVSVTGTVRNMQWQYPHSWLWIVANGSAGNSDEIWGFEMPAVSSLLRAQQWSREALPKGEKVTVYFAPLRDGRKAGLANAIVRNAGPVLHAAPNAFGCEKLHWIQAASGSPGDATFK